MRVLESFGFGRLASRSLVLAAALRCAVAAPEAVPQQDVYQFSGAVYIVNGQGQAFSGAAPAICPNNAPQSCGAINVWNWCCAAGCSCYQLQNGVVGCCPQGQTCQGSVAAAGVTTVTVYSSYPTTVYTSPYQTTTYGSQATVVVVAGAPPTTTITTQGGYVYTTATYQTVTAAGAGGYCSTLTAKGKGLPTTRQGECGTILVVNNAISLWADAWQVLRIWSCIWFFVVSIFFFMY